MTITSRQAAVPTHRDQLSLLRAAVTTQPGVVVLPPNIVTVNGQALAKKPYCAFRQLQNCGTNAVKFLVDNVNDCTENNFHGILAGGSAQDDGLGSVVNFGVTGDRVTIFSTAGSHRVCVFEGNSPETRA